MMSQPERSPLARLVLFMVCLSIAATFVAGMHYELIDRPEQVYASHPPENKNYSPSQCSENFFDVLFCYPTGGSLGIHDQTFIMQCCWD
ncbi:MAG: hypothetical protein GYA23_00890 [Methanomicrobiales archaeon]|nr:hypothetical protein [Methanomicrobiales archaeon]